MFTLNYFWFFILASFFFGATLDFARGPQVGYNPLFKILASIVSGIVGIAMTVFIIIAFFKMPSWWMPIVMFIFGIPIASNIPRFINSPTFNLFMILIGLIAAPLFIILAYLGMYGVI